VVGGWCGVWWHWGNLFLYISHICKLPLALAAVFSAVFLSSHRRCRRRHHRFSMQPFCHSAASFSIHMVVVGGCFSFAPHFFEWSGINWTILKLHHPLLAKLKTYRYRKPLLKFTPLA